MPSRAVRWESASAVPTDLGAVGGGAAINNSGQVGGRGSGGAAIWTGTTLTVLHVDTGAISFVSGLNDFGQAVGEIEGRATLWNGIVAQDLGTLGGQDPRSTAQDINNLGQVVGFSFVDASHDHEPLTHATTWTGGSITPLDLNNL